MAQSAAGKNVGNEKRRKFKMIIVTEGKTVVQGTRVELGSEFCSLVNNLVNGKDGKEPLFTEDDINYFISLAFLSHDELQAKAMDALSDILSTLQDSEFSADDD